MFQSLTPNQKIYILHKSGSPSLETGIVQNVSPPKNDPVTSYGQMPTQSVDITVLVNGQTFTYTLPATGIIGTLRGNGSMEVSMSREAMSNAVSNLKQTSIDVINSVEYHQGVISKCDEIWRFLNPEAIEKEQQKTEINDLKNQVSSLTTNMQQLMDMNRRLMEQLGNDRSSKSKNKEQ